MSNPPCLNGRRFLIMNSIENRESDERPGGRNLPFGILYLASPIAHPGPLNMIEHKIFTVRPSPNRNASFCLAAATDLPAVPLSNTQYGTRSPTILSTGNEKPNTKKHEKTRVPAHHPGLSPIRSSAFSVRHSMFHSIFPPLQSAPSANAAFRRLLPFIFTASNYAAFIQNRTISPRLECFNEFNVSTI